MWGPYVHDEDVEKVILPSARVFLTIPPTEFDIAHTYMSPGESH
jgi:hypothetical protein